MLACPAIIIQKQIFKAFLSDLTTKLGKEIKALFTLNGKRIRTVIQVPMYCQVLVASTEKEFVGIKGLDRLQAIVDAKPFRESSMRKHEEEEGKMTQWL